MCGFGVSQPKCPVPIEIGADVHVVVSTRIAFFWCGLVGSVQLVSAFVLSLSFGFGRDIRLEPVDELVDESDDAARRAHVFCGEGFSQQLQVGLPRRLEQVFQPGP